MSGPYTDCDCRFSRIETTLRTCQTFRQGCLAGQIFHFVHRTLLSGGINKSICPPDILSGRTNKSICPPDILSGGTNQFVHRIYCCLAEQRLCRYPETSGDFFSVCSVKIYLFLVNYTGQFYVFGAALVKLH